MSPYYFLYFKVKIVYLALSNWKKEATGFSETSVPILNTCMASHSGRQHSFHVTAMRISRSQ